MLKDEDALYDINISEYEDDLKYRLKVKKIFEKNLKQGRNA